MKGYTGKDDGVIFGVDDTVRAFDPRTLGVVKHGRVVKVGRKYAHIDFGLSGVAKVLHKDVLEVTV